MRLGDGADAQGVIVRYTGLGHGSWLRTGEEYVVLAVHASIRDVNPLTFMVYVPDDSAFDWGLWPTNLFEVLSPTLPSSWVYASDGIGGFDLMPAAWLRAGHWDDLDPSELDRRSPEEQQTAIRRAWADHRTERDKILAESGRPPGHQSISGPSCYSRPRKSAPADID